MSALVNFHVEQLQRKFNDRRKLFLPYVLIVAGLGALITFDAAYRFMATLHHDERGRTI